MQNTTVIEALVDIVLELVLDTSESLSAKTMPLQIQKVVKDYHLLFDDFCSTEKEEKYLLEEVEMFCAAKLPEESPSSKSTVSTSSAQRQTNALFAEQFHIFV